jgi:4-amino-4-deoxy-L-arabinose transferase-like glycosyltransferase
VKQHAPLAVILAVFAMLFFSTLDSHRGLMWDEAEYANLGRDIQLGRDYASGFRPPLIPLAVAATLTISNRSDDHIVKIPIALAGLIGLALVYLFLCREFDSATGVMGAGCLGAMPAYWIHTSYLLTEVPFLVFSPERASVSGRGFMVGSNSSS